MFCENTNVLQTVWPLEAAGKLQTETSDDAFKGSATLNAAQSPLEAAGQPQSGPCDAFKGFATLNAATSSGQWRPCLLQMQGSARGTERETQIVV